MPKILKITCVDGRVFERDISNEVLADQNGRPVKALITTPCDDPLYFRICFGIATGGYNDPSTSKDHAKYIPPSQIKEVEVFQSGAASAVMSVD